MKYILFFLFFFFAILPLQNLHAFSSQDFVITVHIENDGDSFEIPIDSKNFTYSYTVDCDNDGSIDFENQKTLTTCAYERAGDYTIVISDATGTNDGFPAIRFANSPSASRLLSVEQWGSNNWKSFYRMFYGAENIIINAKDTPNLTQVTNMSETFWQAKNIGNGSGNWNWDTSNITDMSDLFFMASSFNADISRWNTQNVVDMRNLFNKATKFNQNISQWNTQNVVDMRNMFYEAKAFNADISAWNVANVEEMGGMFYRAVAFQGNIGRWNTSKVVDMSDMFSFATAFNADLSYWNTENVVDMKNMFWGAESFGTKNTPSIEDVKVPGVLLWMTAFRGRFPVQDTPTDATTSPEISPFGLSDKGIGNWNTSQVKDMSGMFWGVKNFNDDISSWNTENVEDMEYMFYKAKSFNRDLSRWNMSKVKNTNDMFYGTQVVR